MLYILLCTFRHAPAADLPTAVPLQTRPATMLVSNGRRPLMDIGTGKGTGKDSAATAKDAKPAQTANKTVPTGVDPEEFISTVNTTETRRSDARTLLTMMQEITGQDPYMWGPSIIGFGEYHYKYASGREGDAPAVGFSPRKANLVLYGLSDAPGSAELLEQLGKFKASVACVYINKLADVDLDVLSQLIAMTYAHTTTTDIQSKQSQRK